jgi:hypothetical protein
MANFVDGRTLRSASGQTIHVTIGRTVTIGLYGPIDFAGKPIALVPDFARNLRITPGSMRGNIRMYTVAGIKIGLTHVGAVTSTGDVWDTVDIVVHVARKKRLPTWDKLFAAYPGDAESSPDFRARVGGAVDDDAYTNTCTLRLSEAFNDAGAPIPAHHPGLLAVKGGDGLFYAHRVAEFKRYIVAAYGQPDTIRTPTAPQRTGVDKAAFAGLRGVICFEVRWRDATGHFSLWDGANSVHGDYFREAYQVSLWFAT